MTKEKTICATCLEKGQGYPMTEAELQLHYDANLDHWAKSDEESVVNTKEEPVAAPCVGSGPRFTEWREDELGGKPRPWYWFEGLEYDANELVFKGLKVPETPPCDL